MEPVAAIPTPDNIILVRAMKNVRIVCAINGHRNSPILGLGRERRLHIRKGDHLELHCGEARDSMQ
jgi:hypothetical protein